MIHRGIIAHNLRILFQYYTWCLSRFEKKNLQKYFEEKWNDLREMKKDAVFTRFAEVLEEIPRKYPGVFQVGIPLQVWRYFDAFVQLRCQTSDPINKPVTIPAERTCKKYVHRETSNQSELTKLTSGKSITRQRIDWTNQNMIMIQKRELLEVSIRKITIKISLKSSRGHKSHKLN